MRMLKRLASALTAAALLTVPAFASAQTTTPQPEPSLIDASVTTPPATTSTTPPVTTSTTVPTTPTPSASVTTPTTTTRQIAPFAALAPRADQIVTKCDYRSGAATEQGPYLSLIHI